MPPPTLAIFLLYCVAFGPTARAQSPALTGRVVDAVTQEPLPGASVAVLGAGENVVGGAATDTDGAGGDPADAGRSKRPLPYASRAPRRHRRDRRPQRSARPGRRSERERLLRGRHRGQINHFATQGATGGALGLLNVDFIREATLYTGGFPVRYGDAAASVLVVENRPGSYQEFAFADVDEAGADVLRNDAEEEAWRIRTDVDLKVRPRLTAGVGAGSRARPSPRCSFSVPRPPPRSMRTSGL